jgi:hypothetical protein
MDRQAETTPKQAGRKVTAEVTQTDEAVAQVHPRLCVLPGILPVEDRYLLPA